MFFSIIIFLFTLSILVLSHELGHFIMARRAGCKIEEFGIGFPPRIFKKYGKDGVLYSINLIPIGGYVKILGENNEDTKEIQNDPRSYVNKSFFEKISFLSAGVIMNFFLGVLLIMVGFYFGMPPITPDHIDDYPHRSNLRFIEVEKDSPAEQAGIKVGDILLAYDDFKITNPDEEVLKKYQEYLSEKNGQEVNLSLLRGKEIIAVTVIPEILEGEERARTGTVLPLVPENFSYHPLMVPVYALYEASSFMAVIPRELYLSVKKKIAGEEIAMTITGPVGIAVMSDWALKNGAMFYLQFVINLTLMLAFFNILPIPALDGGRILFVLVEKLKGKRFQGNKENYANLIGFVLLVFLLLVVTVRDIVQYTNVDEWMRRFF